MVIHATDSFQVTRSGVSTILVLAGNDLAGPLLCAIEAHFANSLVTHVVLLGGEAKPPFGAAQVIQLGRPRTTSDLKDIFRRYRVEAIIDASDPFDLSMGMICHAAAGQAGIPCLVLQRSLWRRHPMDRWIEVANIPAAIKAAPDVAKKLLLALPEPECKGFLEHSELECVVRLEGPAIMSQTKTHAAAVEFDRGARSEPGEGCLLDRHDIGMVVMRATGCERLRPLVNATRARDLPLLMVRRGKPGPGTRTNLVEDALAWLSGEGPCGVSSLVACKTP
ncbi:MAG: hypothetical protein CMM47_11695 [Rhodospirillaceae bacterium]|nr:hypothetical protein [Rhodospirillaceae bacterium]